MSTKDIRYKVKKAVLQQLIIEGERNRYDKQLLSKWQVAVKTDIAWEKSNLRAEEKFQKEIQKKAKKVTDDLLREYLKDYKESIKNQPGWRWRRGKNIILKYYYKLIEKKANSFSKRLKQDNKRVKTRIKLLREKLKELNIIEKRDKRTNKLGLNPANQAEPNE